MEKENIPTVKTLVEMFVGRLSVAYQEDPARAAAVVDWMIRQFKIKGGEKVRQTYSIELKFNPNDDELHKIMMHMMRKKAREVVAAAQLISDNPDRPPEIMFQTNDFFEGGTKQSLQEVGDFESEPETELKEENE